MLPLKMIQSDKPKKCRCDRRHGNDNAGIVSVKVKQSASGDSKCVHIGPLSKSTPMTVSVTQDDHIQIDSSKAGDATIVPSNINAVLYDASITIRILIG